MDAWNKRIPEIANLLNPYFCSAVLYNTIQEYQKKVKRGFPITLIYLVLPIVLHKYTRERVTSRTNMVVWIQRYPDVLITFPSRANSLVSFANESIEFLLQRKVLKLDHNELFIIKTLSRSKMDGVSDQEIHDCFVKAKHIGSWFAQMGAEENIYAAWGVKP